VLSVLISSECSAIVLLRWLWGIGSVQERSTARTDACDRMILVVRQYQLGAWGPHLANLSKPL